MAGRPQTLSEGQKKEVTRHLWNQILVASLAVLGLLGGITGLSLWGIKCRLEQQLQDLVAEQFKEPRVNAVVSNVASTRAESLLTHQIMPEVSKFKLEIAAQVADTKQLVTATEQQLRDLSALIEKSSRDAEQSITTLNQQVQEQRVAEKLLKATIEDAQKVLADLKVQSEFILISTAAQSDDRSACDQLIKWAEDPTFPLREYAERVFLGIRREFYGDRGQKNWTILRWNEGVKPDEFTLKEVQKNWRGCPSRVARGYVQFVCDHPKLSKEEKLSFMHDVLSDSRNSLHAADAAARVLAEEGKIAYNSAFSFSEIEAWWTKRSTNNVQPKTANKDIDGD
jgi:hypothetical protein